MTQRRPGLFLVFEGLDGSGTTTQSRLLRDHLRARGEEAVVTAEPSGGPTGSLIRLMLGKRIVSSSAGSDPAELGRSSLALLFAADRIDHLQHEILPRLEGGVHVICDRYILSSLAYQLADDRANFDWVRTINDRALRPDGTVFLEVPVAACEERRHLDRRHRDLFEEPEILRRVREHYLFSLEALRDEGQRIDVVDGTPPVETVFEEVLARFRPLFAEHERTL